MAATLGRADRKVAVVTGGASGLGREIAADLDRAGFQVVVVARSPPDLGGSPRAGAPSPSRATPSYVATSDLAEVGEVRRVASVLAESLPRLDLLVNNAGGIFAPRQLTRDGYERTFALNVLAPFALTYRLAPLLARTGSARVVNLGSGAHRGQLLDLDDLMLEHRFGGYRAYGRSKLAVLLLTREFGRRLAGSGVSVLAVHPGIVRTNFGRNLPGALGLALRFGLGLAGKSPRRGAVSPTFAALDPSLEGTSGAYVARRGVRAGSMASRDAGVAGPLFEACRALTGLEHDALTGPPPSREPSGPTAS